MFMLTPVSDAISLLVAPLRRKHSSVSLVLISFPDAFRFDRLGQEVAPREASRRPA